MQDNIYEEEKNIYKYLYFFLCCVSILCLYSFLSRFINLEDITGISNFSKFTNFKDITGIPDSLVNNNSYLLKYLLFILEFIFEVGFVVFVIKFIKIYIKIFKRYNFYLKHKNELNLSEKDFTLLITNNKYQKLLLKILVIYIILDILLSIINTIYENNIISFIVKFNDYSSDFPILDFLILYFQYKKLKIFSNPYVKP